MNLTEIPNIVLVASGKGGVGKTTVAADIARYAASTGLTAGLIDADISTPNAPEVLGGEDYDVGDQRLSTRDSLVPPKVDGVQLISQGTVLPEDVAVLRDAEWRAREVVDFIESVEWDDDTDIVVVDSPPGTGEELQVIASMAQVEHAFIVTTPHPSSVRDARKTRSFFGQAEIPHSYVVNMAYVTGEDIADHVNADVDFTEVEQVGDSRADEIAAIINEYTSDFPLFGFDGGEDLDIDAPHSGTIPYTTDQSRRQSVIAEALRGTVMKEEVEA